MATSPTQVEAVQIPNRLYFRIGDVVRLTGIKAYVLRYWESEFPMLAPKKSGTNQRLYRRKDVEAVLQIKHLLYEKRFTIEGARTYLQEKRRNEARPAVKAMAAAAAAKQGALFAPEPAPVAEIRRELKAILGLLE